MTKFVNVEPLLAPGSERNVIAFVVPVTYTQTPCIQFERAWLNYAEAVVLRDWLTAALGDMQGDNIP